MKFCFIIRKRLKIIFWKFSINLSFLPSQYPSKHFTHFLKEVALPPGMDPTKLAVAGDYTQFMEPVSEPPKPKKKSKAERRAEKKAAKIQQEIEDRKLVITDHLRRELELSKRSAQRGRDSWMEMCREIKVVELREELKAWNRKVDRQVIAKDEQIAAMIGDIEATEEVHRRLYTKQVEMLDYLLEVYNCALESTKGVHEANVVYALTEFHTELNARDNRIKEVQEYCENIMHATNLNVRNEMFDDFEAFQVQLTDHVDTEIERRYVIRDQVVQQMKQLQEQFVEFLRSLTDTSLDTLKYERINSLMERQRLFAAETIKLNTLEINSNRTQNELIRELAELEAQAVRRIEDLRLEQTYFVGKRQKIEQVINYDRQVTHDKLSVMATKAFEVMKYLKKFEKQGELLLSLAANCRKMQTEEEKVLIPGQFDPTLDVEIDLEKLTKVNVLELYDHLDITDAELGRHMQLMGNFWRRQAKAEAENLLLKEQRDTLVAENTKYINIIKSLGKTENIDELVHDLIVTPVLLPFHEEECAGEAVMP